MQVVLCQRTQARLPVPVPGACNSSSREVDTSGLCGKNTQRSVYTHTHTPRFELLKIKFEEDSCKAWWPLPLNQWEAEAGGSPRVQGQPGEHSELHDNESYVKRPCLQRKGKKGLLIEVDISARHQGLTSCFPGLQPFPGIPLPLCLSSQCFPIGPQGVCSLVRASPSWPPPSPSVPILPSLQWARL